MTQWIDQNSLQWVGDNLSQWSTEAVSSLVDINGLGAFYNFSGGITTVWANDTTLYMGTRSNGVKYINKSDITTDTDDPVNLEDYVHDYTDFGFTSPEIKYIHGYENYMVVCTTSGVDAIKHNPQGYRSYTTCSGAQKCFMTSTGRFYYTISGSSDWSLDMRNNPLTDWGGSDSSYATGSGIFAAGIKLNDIYITESTGSDGASNTIFTATSSGIYKIDETDDTYSIYYKE